MMLDENITLACINDKMSHASPLVPLLDSIIIDNQGRISSKKGFKLVEFTLHDLTLTFHISLSKPWWIPTLQHQHSKLTSKPLLIPCKMF